MLLFFISFLISPARAFDITDELMRARLTQQTCFTCQPNQMIAQALQARRDWMINGIDVDPSSFGFHDADEPGLPPAVRRAAESVFQVVIFDRDAKNYDQYISLADLVTITEQTKLLGPEWNWWQHVLEVQLAHCQKEKTATCAIPSLDHPQTGSAFLVGEGGWRLNSADHIFAEAMLARLRRATFIGLEDLVHGSYGFDIYLFDRFGHAVATPYDNHARLLALPRTLRGERRLDRDLIKFEMVKSLRRPGLKPAARAPGFGEKTYHLGFANCTGCGARYVNAQDWVVRGSRFPFSDAPGGELRVTVGTVFAANGVVGSVADGIMGMSGGPALNERGEVSGVNVGFTLVQIGAQRKEDDPNSGLLHVLVSAFPNFDDRRDFASAD